MAANRILDQLKAFGNFASTGFKYNLQVLPDTITASALLFSLLFQSPPLASLGVGFIVLNLLHPYVADFMTRVVSNTVGPEVDPSLCSGSFPGISYERLLTMSSERTFGSLSRTGWPSYYSMFLGFLSGWIGLLPLIYNKEISASPQRKAASTLGLIVLGLVVALAAVFRTTTSCDTVFGLGVGLFSGAVVGAFLVIGLAWLSDRRLTNILQFPLIRGRSSDGKPIYVCAKGNSRTQ
jgi:hypothetical protein